MLSRMTTEREKMLSGALYEALDPELVALRRRARRLCRELNASDEAEDATRRPLLMELFGEGGDSAWIQPRDLPDDVFAAGNPCRVVRRIPSAS